jgi:hypothetical protein
LASAAGRHIDLNQRSAGGGATHSEPLTQIKACRRAPMISASKHGMEEARMKSGEMWYLALVMGAFFVFIVALAWCERTWRPKGAQAPSAQPEGVDRHAA